MSKLKYYDGTEWKTVNGQITGDTLPIGAIIPYGSTTAPVNWLVCDGSAVSRTTYAELFAIIGTSYGAGDGSTTFNLPNYKGRVPVGYDSSDTDFDSIGETGGSKALQQHNHTVGGDALASHGTLQQVSNVGVSLISGGGYWGPDIFGLNKSTTENTGTGNSGNLQPYQVSCFIIKAFQSSGLIANVSNTQSNSQSDTYSCDYINKLHSYSTTEQVIGTWIDGSTLYGKTIVFDNINLSNGQTALSIGVANGYIRFIKDGTFTMTSGYRFPLNCYWSLSQGVSTIINNDNKSILIWCDYQNTIDSLTVYVEYTKTS